MMSHSARHLFGITQGAATQGETRVTMATHAEGDSWEKKKKPKHSAGDKKAKGGSQLVQGVHEGDLQEVPNNMSTRY